MRGSLAEKILEFLRRRADAGDQEAAELLEAIES